MASGMYRAGDGAVGKPVQALANNIPAPDPKKAGVVDDLPSKAIYATDAATIAANFHALVEQNKAILAALQAAGIVI